MRNLGSKVIPKHYYSHSIHNQTIEVQTRAYSLRKTKTKKDDRYSRSSLC